MRFRPFRRAPSVGTGIVLGVPSPRVAAALEAELRSDRRFDLVEVVAVQPRLEQRAGTDPLSDWSATLAALGRFGPEGAEAAVRSIVAASDPAHARVLLRMVDLHLGGDPFVVLVIDPTSARPSAASIAAVADAIDAALAVAERPTEVRTARLSRPVVSSPASSIDPDLLAILVGPDAGVAEAVDRWFSPDAVRTQSGFSTVGSVVVERLRRLGIVVGDGDLLDGLRRRTWYRNTLLLDDAVAAVRALRDDGIDPVALGHLPTVVDAAAVGRVRSLGEVVLLVAPGEIERARTCLRDAFGAAPPSAVTDADVIELDGGRILRLTTRWSRANGDARVPLGSGLLTSVVVRGDVVGCLAPTARSLDLWFRALDRRRHDRLASVVAVAELLGGRADEIDREWVDRACRHLDLPSPLEAFAPPSVASGW